MPLALWTPAFCSLRNNSSLHIAIKLRTLAFLASKPGMRVYLDIPPHAELQFAAL